MWPKILSFNFDYGERRNDYFKTFLCLKNSALIGVKIFLLQNKLFLSQTKYPLNCPFSKMGFLFLPSLSGPPPVFSFFFLNFIYMRMQISNVAFAYPFMQPQWHYFVGIPFVMNVFINILKKEVENQNVRFVRQKLNFFLNTQVLL